MGEGCSPVPRYGVIDIGSNGIRMILAEVQDGQVQVLQARREHVRLGTDVYQHGEISPAVMAEVVAAIRDFSREFQAAEVQQTKAIATAATREARNRDQLVTNPPRAVAANRCRLWRNATSSDASTPPESRTLIVSTPGA